MHNSNTVNLTPQREQNPNPRHKSFFCSPFSLVLLHVVELQVVAEVAEVAEVVVVVCGLLGDVFLDAGFFFFFGLPACALDGGGAGRGPCATRRCAGGCASGGKGR